MSSPTKVVTINTEEGVVKREEQKEFTIYDGYSEALRKAVPEYNSGFPNPALEHFINKLKETKNRFGGLGLSANQCGFSMRLFVMGVDDMEYVCINPEVLEASEGIVKAREGCLSFPGLFANIRRPEWVRVAFLNEKGEREEITISGLTARCFQHELDHLNGKTMVDHLGAMGLRLAKDRQKKMIKKIQRSKFDRR